MYRLHTHSGQRYMLPQPSFNAHTHDVSHHTVAQNKEKMTTMTKRLYITTFIIFLCFILRCAMRDSYHTYDVRGVLHLPMSDVRNVHSRICAKRMDGWMDNDGVRVLSPYRQTHSQSTMCDKHRRAECEHPSVWRKHHKTIVVGRLHYYRVRISTW